LVEVLEYYVSRTKNLELAIKWFKAWNSYCFQEFNRDDLFLRERYERGLKKLKKARERMISLV
jgi:hypothetical protein